MYYKAQKDFYNMVIEIETNLNPLELLHEVKKIEIMAGRNPHNKENMPRVLDVDILAVGDLIIRSNLLSIPHPKIAERKFVLKPWNDIAPNFIIPNYSVKVCEMLYNSDDLSEARMVLIFDKKGII